MRIAALYDIHANLPAPEAVLQEVREVKADRIVVGGDVLPVRFLRRRYGFCWTLIFPQSSSTATETARCLRRWMASSPIGIANLLNIGESRCWTAQQLQSSYRPLLASWPSTCQAGLPGLGDLLFCQATPHNDTDVFTRLTPEDRLIPLFQGLGFSIAICGHTHMQFDRMVGTTRVVNAGSVGMPFGDPGAHWLLLGPGVHFRHTRYDFLRAADRIRRSTYPQANDFAEHSILRPPTEEETLAAFSRAELNYAAVAILALSGCYDQQGLIEARNLFGTIFKARWSARLWLSV